MAAAGITIVLDQIPRPLYVSLMVEAARRALPLDTHVRDLLVRISERPDPVDIMGARPVEG